MHPAQARQQLGIRDNLIFPGIKQNKKGRASKVKGSLRERTSRSKKRMHLKQVVYSLGSLVRGSFFPAEKVARLPLDAAVSVLPARRGFRMSTSASGSLGERVAAFRKNYESKPFREEDLLPERNPIAQFDNWFSLAASTDAHYDEVNSMTLATCTPDGRPSARIVLLKGYDQRGFRFFTNYNSRKGRELLQNPYAALVFYWAAMNRSVRVEGRVEKLSEEESEKYFHSRPHGSQLGAAVSHQSQVVADRTVLEEKWKEAMKNCPEGTVVKKPDEWGGFLVRHDVVEFWQGQSSRLHDRIRFRRGEKEEEEWIIERLSP